MKLLRPKCPVCGEYAYGTCDTLMATAVLTEPDENGEIDYVGETNIEWDTQTTITNKAGRIEVTCGKHSWFTTKKE